MHCSNPIPVRQVMRFLLLAFISTYLLNACVPTEKSLADKQAYAENEPEYRNKFSVVFDEGEKPIRFGYHYIVSTVPEGYRVRVFHPDKKTLTEMKTYSTSNLTLLHGPYESYWDDGSIRAQGIYQYGRKHGMWLESEPSKGKSSSGMYFNQRKEGQWTQLDTNGLIESVYNWHDDTRHGKFFLYDSMGNKTNEGIYRADTLISELFKQPVTIKPYLTSCEENIFSDVYVCTETTVASTLYTNLKYPAKAKAMKIEGVAVVQWDIMPDGSVTNIRVPQSLSDEIEKEILRALKLNERWVPALKDGKPVKYTMTLPVNFRIS
jgi:TonB family protein